MCIGQEYSRYDKCKDCENKTALLKKVLELHKDLKNFNGSEFLSEDLREQIEKEVGEK